MSNPLDPIMTWYQVVLDSIRVTSRVIEQDIRKAITPKHIFFREPIPTGLAMLEDAKGEVSDLVVLALVSTFERSLRDFLFRLPKVSTPGSTPLEEAVRIELGKDLEFWRLSDRVLDVFAPQVPPNLTGQIRQIIEYRNWVAHGRSTSNPPSTNVVPQFAYKALSEYLRLAGAI